MREASVSFVMSWLSVSPHAASRLPRDVFPWNFIFDHFSKIYREISSLIKIGQKITDTSHGDRYTFLIYLAHFFLEWEIFQTKNVEKIKTHILCSVIFFSRKSYRLWDNVEKKNIVDPGRTHDNMAHAHCMTNTKGYKRTLRICNTYCFSTATVITQMSSCVRFSVHCLSCLTFRPLTSTIVDVPHR